MAVTQGTVGNGGCLTIDVTGCAAVAIGNIPNPEGVALRIVRTWWSVTTVSTGAATINIGIGTEAADSSDLISALDVNGATGFWNGIAQVVAAKTAAGLAWAADTHLNFTGSATTAGLVGRFFVEYVRTA